jgi:tetratricopeptide (TPR) repeat protein
MTPIRSQLPSDFRAALVLLAAVLLPLVAGCATTSGRLTAEERAAIEARLDALNPPDQLRPLYRILYLEGERNHVLNAMKLAGVAIRRGYPDDAKRVLDEAIVRIQAITVGPEAAAARRTFREEAVKPFKGEPYERVMVYFYRGLLYYRDGEYDNARACFRSGQFEDAQAEGEEHRGDYASLDYLEARCSQKLNNPDAAAALERAGQNLRRGGLLPSTDPGNNLLLVLGVGKGPMKYCTGRHCSELRFQEQYTPEVRARVFVNGKAVEGTAELDNLYWQATTRGGRVMDHILAGKAVFKDTAGTVGDIGLMTGVGLGIAGAHSSKSRDELLIAGAAAATVGIIGKMLESGARPEADTRYWDNLPGSIQIASLKLTPGGHRVKVEFLDAKGVEVAGLGKEFTVTIPSDNKEQVIIVHSR